MTIEYIRFNSDDLILGAHKVYVTALSNSKFNETYIDTNDYDLSSLCDPSEFKKGNTIKGLWSFVDAIRMQKYLDNLMVDYLSKIYVKSDQTIRELAEKGLKKHEQLLDSLALYHINFDDWINNHTESGKALMQKINAQELADAEKATLARAELEKANEHFAGACFSLPAIAGKMGNNLYYSVQIPLPQLSQLFSSNQNDLPVELRSQRILNEKRAKDIAQYMIDRKHDYTLPALTAAVSESMKFEPAKGFSNVGMVQIPIGAQMAILDGQHRNLACSLCLETNYHDFKDQSLTVLFFYDQGLANSQQIFSDINSSTVRPSKSLCILFDHSNKFNRLIIESIEKTGIKNAIDFEKASPGAKSSKVWSVIALKKAIETVTGLNDKKAKLLDDDQYEDYKNLIVNWINAVIEHSRKGLNQAIFNGDASMLSVMRSTLVITHAVYLYSVALASVHLCKEFNDYQADPFIKDLKGECPIPTFYDLNCLRNITDSKASEVWVNRIVKVDGTMNINANAIKLGAYVILKSMEADIPHAIAEINDVFFAEQV